MFTKFTDIINGLKVLGRTFTNQEMVNKVLICLPKSWDAKTTAIKEAQDLRTLPLEELFGSLMTYELENTIHMDGESNQRNIALRASSSTSKTASRRLQRTPKKQIKNISQKILAVASPISSDHSSTSSSEKLSSFNEKEEVGLFMRSVHNFHKKT